jgi:hypothetical protein
MDDWANWSANEQGLLFGDDFDGSSEKSGEKAMETVGLRHRPRIRLSGML